MFSLAKRTAPARSLFGNERVCNSSILCLNGTGILLLKWNGVLQFCDLALLKLDFNPKKWDLEAVETVVAGQVLAHEWTPVGADTCRSGHVSSA